VADALIKADRLEEAAAVLQAALPLNPRPQELHRRLAQVYAALGRTEESARERRTYMEQRLEELRRGG
jgi:predicted Zn-dependent protease